MIHRFNIRIQPQLHILFHNLKPMLRAAMLATLKVQNADRACEIHAELVDDPTILDVNFQHRGIGRVTDVLSFPLQQHVPGQPLSVGAGDLNPRTGRLMLGDIMLCLPQAQRQAFEYGHSLEREAAFLTVHSTLHLLGYDHEDEREGDVMRLRERAVMERLGL
ncbi:endoribonuclease YbeY [Clostridia bacterium]|nr:endoribonuclease YbeY [Clostridia bacterium]